MFRNITKKLLPLMLAAALLFAPAESYAADKTVSFTAGTNALKLKSAKILANMEKLKAGKDYVGDEVLVRAKNEGEAIKIAERCGAELESFGKHGVAVLKLKKGDTAVSAIADNIKSDEQDFVVYPNFIYTIDNSVQYTPGDPDYCRQYFHQNMNNPAAWDVTKGSPGVVVAVIDTGIDTDHPEFSGRISDSSYNAWNGASGVAYVDDDHGHGTHVAGIIAAAQDNGQGGSGTAPGVTIMAIKANEPGTGVFSGDDLIEAIYHAADNGADIINLSLGRSYSEGGYTLEQQAIQYAAGKGVLVVAAAGNERAGHANYPAAYGECVAVSAVKQDNTFDASYSNYGPEVDIAAPGTAVYSSVPGGYAYMQGTSMAAPQVAGAAALILSAMPELNLEGLKRRLYDFAVDMGSAGRDDYYGYGALNTGNALAGVYFTVSFESNGGTAVPAVTAAPGCRIMAPEPPKRDWHTFGGWFKDKGLTDDWDFAADIVTGNTRLYAKWSLAIPARVSTPVASSSSYNSIRISWKAVAGATGYEVYRKTGSGSYSLIKTTSAASYTDKSLSTGKTYYYKIRAYKTVGASKYYTGASAAVAAKPAPAAPAAVKTYKLSATKVKITWKKVPGATGYRVYRATSKNGRYSCIARTSSLSYVSRTQKKGRTYYYKVRAYRSVRGSRVYGGYSSATGVKL